jgi:hypothetical protein
LSCFGLNGTNPGPREFHLIKIAGRSEEPRKYFERLVATINSTAERLPDAKSDPKKILNCSYKHLRSGDADKTTSFPPEVALIQLRGLFYTALGDTEGRFEDVNRALHH